MLTDPSWMDNYWLVWLIGSLVVGFGAIETWAIVDEGKGGTLTEWTRRQLGVYPDKPRRKWAVPAFIVVLLALVAWLIPHMTHWPWKWPWEPELEDKT